MMFRLDLGSEILPSEIDAMAVQAFEDQLAIRSNCDDCLAVPAIGGVLGCIRAFNIDGMEAAFVDTAIAALDAVMFKKSI